jgi:hypothetical protein
MAIDYDQIRAENQSRYGTDIGRIGPMLLSNRYDDRTHFIFELLQNAEDALARRPRWLGCRTVRFDLQPDRLIISHFGMPFDEPDVRGICGIAESTKDLTAIGRFGIGFKSVYAFSERPEIHSGEDDFCIESFVWPTAVPVIERDPDETVFVLPFRDPDAHAHDEVLRGLRELAPRSLLFLKEIGRIEWAGGGESDGFEREVAAGPCADSELVRLSATSQGEREEVWLVFARSVRTPEGRPAGEVSIAFELAGRDDGTRGIVPIADSPLVVFFPTVLRTHLGFLVQGPYRTTPSRDNVPRNDEWNIHLVEETATLLAEALIRLRDAGMLDVDALLSLPIDQAKFSPYENMFAPVFSRILKSFRSTELLPAADGSHVRADQAFLARTRELRELVEDRQLAELAGINQATWLIGEITPDRAPLLRQYLMRELDVREMTPDSILQWIDDDFLSRQSDDWIRRLYEYLGAHPALMRQPRIRELPLLRLESGVHVPAWDGEEPLAYLPGEASTGFPTVRREVCSTEESLGFLQLLGLSEPDPVDDVIRNLLPRFHDRGIEVFSDGYRDAISRILSAFQTDSKAGRKRLIGELAGCPFVANLDAADVEGALLRPDELYQPAPTLTRLFDGVQTAHFVARRLLDAFGDPLADLLEACGAIRHLRVVPVASDLSTSDLHELRARAGAPGSTRNEQVDDYTVIGLEDLLVQIGREGAEGRGGRSRALWEALVELTESCGRSVLYGSHRWFWRRERNASFPACFVRVLNDASWIPGPDGRLLRPSEVDFDSLGWSSNALLESLISFQPSIVRRLAEEAGIEPGLLSLLHELGVTSEADLRLRLGLPDGEGHGATAAGIDPGREGAPWPGDAFVSPPSSDAGIGGGDLAVDPSSERIGDGPPAEGPSAGSPSQPAVSVVDGADVGEAGVDQRADGGRNGSTTPRTLMTYVAVDHELPAVDPDGLSVEARAQLEASAIERIRSEEPFWEPTPPGNRGFDLHARLPDGDERWCEVKAMAVSLHDRPVGLSAAQFAFAQEKGERCWLYVVEHAATESSRIIKIRNPANLVSAFTYDAGWSAVAESQLTEDR